jgi:hypothetical protein
MAGYVGCVAIDVFVVTERALCLCNLKSKT